ncbi:MAG: OadG family protein [Pseudohongiella sp.]|nr:OadG family protein [Pseudohongiella sp.]
MNNLLSQGFELALFGMGTVFVFLAVLIIATKAMSSLVLRFEPAVSVASAATVAQDAALSDRGHLLAVISAAIAQHRTTKK